MVGRRSFLRSMAALPATFIPQFARGPQRHVDRLLARNDKPLLIVVRGDDESTMLKAALSRLPQITAALKGKRVVIKPNATASQPYPVTTDSRLLRSIVRQVKQAQAAEITICDSSSFAGYANARVFSKLGYSTIANSEYIRAVATDSQSGSEYFRVSNPAWRSNPYVLTNRIVNRADFVINVAIPKRHHVADFSCALKNNFGCTYDTCRMVAHAGSKDFFDDCVVEFADAVRPNLTIVDARLLLTRFGPTFRQGVSEIVPARQMVVSEDMVAADSYCGTLMEEFDNTFRKSNRLERQLDYAQSLGLGEQNTSRMEIVEIST
jgi:uncharacterized protein (DUF362 family)